jgi:hypothetical protein
MASIDQKKAFKKDGNYYLLSKLSDDRALASAVLFPHRHPQASPPAHIEVMDLWRSADEFVLIEGFREFAKSTLSEEFLCLEGCFGNFRYTLLIGETYAKACQRLESIARECLDNRRLHTTFGGAVLGRKPIENKVWFKAGGLIEAVGWEQELQSFKYLDARPDRAYLDDPENLERVRDSAAVDASMRKLYLELIPAMDKTNRKVRITQTRRAEDCMVTRLAGNPEWVYRGYPICDGDIDSVETASLWPDRYPMSWIRTERDAYKAAGMLGEFLQSYMLQATDPASRPFRDEHIAECGAAPWQWSPKYAIYDPARTSGAKADEYGKVVVSRFGSRIYIHESWGRHLKPDGLIADLFDVFERFSPASIGVEKNSLDEWLLQPVRLAMMKRGVALPLKPLQAPQDINKLRFILGLQPFFEAGDIVLVGGKLAHQQLVAEILNFPQGSLNILNALAYSLKMFAGQPVYEEFSHANIGDAPEPRASDTVYLGFSGGPSETVCVAAIRERSTLFVGRDFAASGPPADAVRQLVGECRAAFPRATFSVWVPAELHDQWQRVPLVPGLRQMGITAYRGEHVALSRGCLKDRIRTVIRNHRALVVDSKAALTANALSAGYCLAIERGGRTTAEPEAGLSRMVAEALECVVSMLDKGIGSDSFDGAHHAVNPQGHRFISALPGRR